MGTNNRQRRAAKKRRQQSRDRRRPTAGADGSRHRREGPDGEWPDDDGALLTLLWTVLHQPPSPTRDVLIRRLHDVGRPAARVALAELVAEVARVWPLGYGPHDLAHLVGRSLDSPHVAVLARAIEEDLRRRGGDTGPWGQQVGDVVEAYRPADAMDIAAAVEVIDLLRRLGAIPPTIGPPGTAGTTDTPRVEVPGPAQVDDPVLTRVRGLLRKAESTTFDAEAEALTAKAQELIARHALDEARLQGTGPTRTGSRTAARRIYLDDPYADAKASLVHQVGMANRCSVVHSPDAGWCTVFGVASDLDATALLTASLRAQAVGAMARLGPQRDRAGRSRTRSFRTSFLYGFAVRIGERLQTATADVLADTEDADALLPVLTSRHDDAEAAAAAAFPRMVRRRGGSVSNGAGWHAGQAAADLASLDVTAGALRDTA